MGAALGGPGSRGAGQGPSPSMVSVGDACPHPTPRPTPGCVPGEVEVRPACERGPWGTAWLGVHPWRPCAPGTARSNAEASRARVHIGVREGSPGPPGRLGVPSPQEAILGGSLCLPAWPRTRLGAGACPGPQSTPKGRRLQGQVRSEEKGHWGDSAAPPAAHRAGWGHASSGVRPAPGLDLPGVLSWGWAHTALQEVPTPWPWARRPLIISWGEAGVQFIRA